MKMEELLVDGRKCRLFGSDKPECLLVQLSARHENAVLDAEVINIEEYTKIPFALAALEVDDWMVDLMPWPDANMSRDSEAGQRGQATLDCILLSLVLELVRRFGNLPIILGGYSLGGLFALWASSQTDRFKGIAAASPSVWIKDWIPFARKHVPMADDVYLSLGDREEFVKNQAIARVGDCMRTQFALLTEQLGGQHCTLVWEQGNHFSDSEGRLARAFAWCMGRLKVSV